MSTDIKQPGAAQTATEGKGEPQIIPVVQEFLSVGKRSVETGKVIVSKNVEQEVKDVSIPLMEDEIIIDRVPIGSTVSAEPASRYEGDTLVIPVVKEELIIQKRLILVEEVRIRKRTIATEFKEQVTLHKEVVEVKEEKAK
jgi:uncharacterized protein (TIGR02271 family)